jgi:hypothetical protein
VIAAFSVININNFLLKEALTMGSKEWQVHNPSGKRRVIVTKELPGDRWLNFLTEADCKIEICTSPEVLSSQEIKAAFGDRCDAAIGQLTEPWGDELFAALKTAGDSTMWMWTPPPNTASRWATHRGC